MVASVDGMAEDEPAPEPAPGAEVRAAKVAWANPFLSAVSAPLKTAKMQFWERRCR